MHGNMNVKFKQIRTTHLFKNTIRKRVNCSKSLIQQEHKWVLGMEFLFIYHGATVPGDPGPPRYRGFTVTLRHIKLGRTPLDEWSVRRQDLHLTTHNSHKTQTSKPPARFEPAIPASERSTPSTARPMGSAVVYRRFVLLLSTVFTQIGWYTLNCVQFVCLFSCRYNPFGRIFHSPVAGFNLLVFEVSWSHKTTHHNR